MGEGSDAYCGSSESGPLGGTRAWTMRRLLDKFELAWIEIHTILDLVAWLDLALSAVVGRHLPSQLLQ